VSRRCAFPAIEPESDWVNSHAAGPRVVGRPHRDRDPPGARHQRGQHSGSLHTNLPGDSCPPGGPECQGSSRPGYGRSLPIPKQLLDSGEFPVEPWARTETPDLHRITVHDVEHSKPTHFHAPDGRDNPSWGRKLRDFIPRTRGERLCRHSSDRPLVDRPCGGRQLKELGRCLTVTYDSKGHAKGPGPDALETPPASLPPAQTHPTGSAG
jgi:hypothetical protein